MTTMLETALDYFAAGLSVLPDDPIEKYPVGIVGWETIEVTEARIREWWKRWPHRGIGIRDVEGVDIDNKGHPSAEILYREWAALVEELAPGLIERLLLEQTPGGGYHVVWTCEIVGKNQKLATRLPTKQELIADPNAKRITLIETRGKGGQFQVAPSPGYTLVRGDWRKLPRITPAERQILLDCARALTQHAQEIVTGAGQTNGAGPRPGDEYNATGAGDALDLLKQAGWKVVRTVGKTSFLCRPGKHRGVSATFGYVAPGVLYVFSSNASPFEPGRAYKPFAIRTALLHGGDFKASAKELAGLGYGVPLTSSTSHAQTSEDDEADEPARTCATISSFPELPDVARLPDDLGRDACSWLDRYITFSRYWSPRSYDDFHEASALFLLSTIAARRVVLHLGGPRFTNLYIALTARTSIWAKSTAAKIAIELLRAAGAAPLMAPDDSTPQAFITSLVARLPGNYAELPGVSQDAIQERLKFVAQKGWWYEEFGQKVSAMMRENGTMADYRGLLRRFDDCPMGYEYSTIGRGTDRVERPYLALMANVTPADLAPFAKKNGALWADGFFARFAFVCPPAEAERKRGRFPDGERIIPSDLSAPLRDWHERLGTPDVIVAEQLDEEGAGTGKYSLEVRVPEPQRCVLGEGVYDAFYRYHDALCDLIGGSTNTDLDGNYARFAEKALRVSMLLASIENQGRIEMRHWARAQQITERWRRNLHNLIDQLQSENETTRESELEDKVMRVIERWGSATVNQLRRDALKGASTEELTRVCESLTRVGALTSEKTRKGTLRYSANGGKGETGNSGKEIISSTIHSGSLNGDQKERPSTASTIPPFHHSPMRQEINSSTIHSGFLNGDQKERPSTASTIPPFHHSPMRQDSEAEIQTEALPPEGGSVQPLGVNMAYVRQMLVVGDEDAIRRHCRIHRADVDEVLAAARQAEVQT